MEHLTNKNDITKAAFISCAKKIQQGWVSISTTMYTQDLFGHLLSLKMIDHESKYFYFIRDIDQFYEYKREVVKKYFADYYQTLRNQDIVLSDFKKQQSFFKHDEISTKEIIEKNLGASEETLQLSRSLYTIESNYLKSLSSKDRLKLFAVPVAKKRKDNNNKNKGYKKIS